MILLYGQELFYLKRNEHYMVVFQVQSSHTQRSERNVSDGSKIEVSNSLGLPDFISSIY